MLGVSDETWERARSEVKTAIGEYVELIHTVRLSVAKLDFLAGKSVSTYSSNLLSILDEWRDDVVRFKPSEATDEPLNNIEEMVFHVHAALFELIDVMRSDIGIEKRTVFRIKDEHRTFVEQ
jgi:hypothetical protein